MAQDPNAVNNPEQGANPWNDNPSTSGVKLYQQPIPMVADKDKKEHGTCQAAAFNNCVQDKIMDCVKDWAKIYGDQRKFILWGSANGFIIMPMVAKDTEDIKDNEKQSMKRFIEAHINNNDFRCIQFSIKYRDGGGSHRVVMVKHQGQWWYLDSNLLPIQLMATQPGEFEQRKNDKEIFADLPYTGKVPDQFWRTIIDSNYFHGRIFVIRNKAAFHTARADDYGEILSNEYYDNEENNNGYIPIMNNDYDYNQYYQNQQQQQKQREAQLLLSPPPQQPLAILPVQYGLNNGNNIYSQNEWLSVLLPILLTAACLFGIICIICTGFGGLFCYREGQKSNGYKYQPRDCKYYHKLPQRDVDDYHNKKDQGLSLYDESV